MSKEIMKAKKTSNCFFPGDRIRGISIELPYAGQPNDMFRDAGIRLHMTRGCLRQLWRFADEGAHRIAGWNGKSGIARCIGYGAVKKIGQA